jgi:hypothetical protein
MRAAVLGIAVLVAFAGCDEGPRGRVVRGDTGWTLTVPQGFHVERSAGGFRGPATEVTVASFRSGAGIRAYETALESGFHDVPPLDSAGRFPLDGVAVRVVRLEGGPPAFEWPGRETSLPLRLRDFRASKWQWEPARGPRPLESGVQALGRSYLVFTWVGPWASAGRRRGLARVVASLSFPRAHEGQQVGRGDVVLGPTSRYPARSFTRVRLHGRAGWVVHSPVGFYVLWQGWRDGGYRARCALELDRARREFFCGNLDARWDRVGRVLVRPRGRRRQPLWWIACDVMSDGHLLASSTLRGGLWTRRARELWPGWQPRTTY